MYKVPLHDQNFNNPPSQNSNFELASEKMRKMECGTCWSESGPGPANRGEPGEFPAGRSGFWATGQETGWDLAEWSKYSRGGKPVDWGEQQPPVGQAGGLARVRVEAGPEKMASCCRKDFILVPCLSSGHFSGRNRNRDGQMLIIKYFRESV